MGEMLFSAQEYRPKGNLVFVAARLDAGVGVIQAAVGTLGASIDYLP